jgi:hypothetical protein
MICHHQQRGHRTFVLAWSLGVAILVTTFTPAHDRFLIVFYNCMTYAKYGTVHVLLRSKPYSYGMVRMRVYTTGTCRI